MVHLPVPEAISAAPGPTLGGIRLSSGAVLLGSRSMPVLTLAKQALLPLSERAEVSYVRDGLWLKPLTSTPVGCVAGPLPACRARRALTPGPSPLSQLHDGVREQHVPLDSGGAPEEVPLHLQPSFAASIAQAAELMSRAKVPKRMQPRGGDPLLRAVVGGGAQWPNEPKVEGRHVARKRLTPSSRSEAMLLASSLDAELGREGSYRGRGTGVQGYREG